MSVDKLGAGAILQYCADQLEVLENIMRDISSNRKLNVKTAQKGLEAGSKWTSIKDGSLPLDNLAKLHRDRQFVSEIINRLIDELQEKNAFQSLFSAVEEEREKKAQHLDIFKREEEGRIRIESLQKHILFIHKDKTEECERLKESIVQLRHQVQNMRVRTEWQGRFVKSCAHQLVCQGQKINSHKEKKLEEEVTMLQDRTEEEKSVHTEMEAFLKRQHASLQEKLQFWMKKYEKDIDEKEQELTFLQNKRSNNLIQLQELSKKCRDMQQVIIEDRTKKEQLQVQLEIKERDRDAATKIQAWWRGTVVRKGLGCPKKTDKCKPKKGKKKK